MKRLIGLWIACVALFGAWQTYAPSVPHFKNLQVEHLLVTPARAQMLAPIVNFGAPRSSFTPANLPNLVAWYTAKTGVSQTAGNVTAWADQSGNGYGLTPNNLPSYSATGFNTSYPAVTFSGNFDWMNTGASAVSVGGTALSVYIVCNISSSFNNSSPFLDYLPSGGSGVGGVKFVPFNSSGDTLSTYGNNTQYFSDAFTPGTNYQFGWIYDGTNVTSYQNNVQQSQSAASFTFSSTGYISLGGDLNSGSTQKIIIAEVVVTSAAISSGNRTNLANYFNAAWGL